jgi:predicted membrane channel-forming protein YqfA (hemolysin III family)
MTDLKFLKNRPLVTLATTPVKNKKKFFPSSQLGITLALLATYLSGIYYAFWCHPVARDFYLVTVAALFLLATTIQFVPNLEAFSKYRVRLFFSWAVYGVRDFHHQAGA